MVAGSVRTACGIQPGRLIVLLTEYHSRSTEPRRAVVIGQFDNKEIPVPGLLQQVESAEKECPVCRDEFDIEVLVEPEVDGEHRYWECEDCGYAWGYERIEQGVRIEGNCSVGVPESVRRAASAPMEKAMAQEAAKQPVPIGLTIGKRPGL